MKKMISLVVAVLMIHGCGDAKDNPAARAVINKNSSAVTINPETAKEYRAAAEEGVAVAQFNLGLMNAEGIGHPSKLRRRGQMVQNGSRSRPC